MLDDQKSDVPMIPNMNFENYQYFVNHWTNWLNFREFHMNHTKLAQME